MSDGRMKRIRRRPTYLRFPRKTRTTSRSLGDMLAADTEGEYTEKAWDALTRRVIDRALSLGAKPVGPDDPMNIIWTKKGKGVDQVKNAFDHLTVLLALLARGRNKTAVLYAISCGHEFWFLPDSELLPESVRDDLERLPETLREGAKRIEQRERTKKYRKFRPEEVRAHYRRLLDSGEQWDLISFSLRIGCSPATLWRIAKGDADSRIPHIRKK